MHATGNFRYQLHPASLGEMPLIYAYIDLVLNVDIIMKMVRKYHGTSWDFVAGHVTMMYLAKHVLVCTGLEIIQILSVILKNKFN